MLIACLIIICVCVLYERERERGECCDGSVAIESGPRWSIRRLKNGAADELGGAWRSPSPAVAPWRDAALFLLVTLCSEN